MFARLGRFTVRWRKAVLAITGLGLVAAVAYGGTVADRLTSGGFDDPTSESSRASAALEEGFGIEEPNLVLLVTAQEGTVDTPAVAGAGAAVTERLASTPHVNDVVSYWNVGGLESLRNRDSTQALVLATIEGDDDAVDERVAVISEHFSGTRVDDVVVDVGGFAQVFREVGKQIERDTTKAEPIAVPITLVLLVLVFGSVVAAGLPLLTGALAVVVTMAVLRGLTVFTDVSIYSLNLTTAMGLGLAIDYSLFIVSRYREELGRGLTPHDAVVRSVETAGRTVVFSALTVAVSLAALLVFPLVFLRSFAYAGIAVALVAAVGAVVLLPALLAVLGTKVDALVLWRRRQKPTDEGVWHRLATFVMRRPIPVATLVIVVLLLLGAPFLHVTFGLPDDRVLPPGADARVVTDQLRENFDASEAFALPVVAPNAQASDDDVSTYARALSQVDGVARVDARTGSYSGGEQVAVPDLVSARYAGGDGTWLNVVPADDVEPYSLEGEELARAVRDEPAPFDTLVGGQSAELVDGKEGVFSRVPLAAMLIAASTFVLLFLMFGGLLVPLKALAINLLSLTATFGAMVWIFQDGHLSGLLDFTATGFLDTTTPILMFCIAWGLSMDYEVFLLSRIKEEYDRTGDNTSAVAAGLERTGRIVTAAALLISVVMLAFGTSSVSFIKLFGIGLALAVLMDAFVIRGTLVPALMRLAGRANWWAPPPLRAFYERFGLREAPGAPVSSSESEPDDDREPVRA